MAVLLNLHRFKASCFGCLSVYSLSVAYILARTKNITNITMNNLDNLCLYQLYDELDKLTEERKYLKQHRKAPDGMTMEEAFQELDEEEAYIKMKIDELSIVQSDFMDCDY